MTIKRKFPMQSEGRSYRYIVTHKDGPYAVESDALPFGKDLIFADALEGAYQQDDLIAVWELNPSEGVMRDISEEIALAMLAGSDASDASDLSDFIRNTLSESQIAERFTDSQSWSDYYDEVSSPEATGRI